MGPSGVRDVRPRSVFRGSLRARAAGEATLAVTHARERSLQVSDRPRLLLQSALFARVVPAGTRFDGDLIFAMAPLAGPSAPQEACEQHAVRALGDAIERAVRLAHGRDGIPGLAD